METLKYVALLLATVASSVDAATIAVNDPASGYHVYNYNSGISQSPELLLVGVYETLSNHYDAFGNHRQGSATVHITDGGGKPIVLALSSYEPTMWNIDVAPNVNISQIILNGYYDQAYSGVSSGLVINKSGLGNYLASCGYSLPYNGGGCDTNYLQSQLESFTGLSLTSFSGVYRATDFTITTSPVPLPSALLLLASGIVGLIGYGKRKS